MSAEPPQRVFQRLTQVLIPRNRLPVLSRRLLPVRVTPSKPSWVLKAARAEWG